MALMRFTKAIHCQWGIWEPGPPDGASEASYSNKIKYIKFISHFVYFAAMPSWCIPLCPNRNGGH